MSGKIFEKSLLVITWKADNVPKNSHVCEEVGNQIVSITWWLLLASRDETDKSPETWGFSGLVEATACQSEINKN